MAAVPCGLCEKSVYPMECIRALGKSFHKLCFKCAECHTILGLKNHESYENKIYCRVHLPKLSGTVITDSVSMETAKAAPKAVLESGVHKPSKPAVAAKPETERGPAPSRPNRGANSAVATRLAAGVPEKACPVCGQRVFTTEEVKALNGSFHKACFKCKDCGMSLNLKTMQSYEGVLYCKVHLPKLSATVVTDDVNTARALSAPKLTVQHGVVVKDPKGAGADAAPAAADGPAPAEPVHHAHAVAAHTAAEVHTEAAEPETYEADAVVPEAGGEEADAVAAEAEVPAEAAEAEGTDHGAGRKCQALFEYEVQEDGELGFKEGEVITITGYPSDDWWTGMTDDGRTGMFPSNYVELLPE